MWRLIINFFIFVSYYNIEGTEPGYRTILTDKGLQFVNDVTKNDIFTFDMKKMTNNSDYLTKQHTFVTDNVSLDFLVFKRSKKNNFVSMLSFVRKNGLRHQVKNMDVTVDGKYKTTSGLSGYFSVEFNQVFLTADVNLTNDKGRINFSQQNCQSNISSIILEFIEGSNLVAVIEKILTTNNDVKSHLEQELCYLENEIFRHGSVANVFTDTTTYTQLFNDYYLENLVLENPDVENSYYETANSGSILIFDNSVAQLVGDVPIQPSKLVDINFNESYDLKMSYVFMSNYTLNSLLYSLWKTNRLNYKLTKDTVANSAQELYLNTDCGENGFCVGILMPFLKENFHNGSLEFFVKAISKPNVVINNGNLTITTECFLQSYVRNSDNSSRQFLFSSNADLVIIVTKFSLSDYSSVAHIANYTLRNFTSSIREVNVQTVKMLFSLAKDFFFEPDLSNLFSNAMVIPRILDFDVDPETSEVLFVEDLIYIALNFKP